MQITSLRLSHFGSHTDFRLPFGSHTTRLVGPNASGKSTVLDALQWVLTGRCRGTDAGGKGSAVLVQAGAQKAEVTLAGRDSPHAGGVSWALTRTVERVGVTSLSLRVVGADGGVTTLAGVDAAAWVATYLGDPALITVALEGGAFLEASHQDAKAWLLRALNVTVSVEGLDLSPVDAADRGHVALGRLEELYDRAYAERRAVKTEAQTLSGRVPAAPTEPAPDLARLEQAYAALQAQHRDTAAAERGGTGEAHARLTAASEALAKAEAALGALQARREGMARLVGLPVGSAADLVAEAFLARVATCDTAAAETALIDQAAIALADSGSRLRALEAGEAVDHDPKSGCVLAGSIPCKTPVKFFRAAAKDGAAALVQARETHATAKAAYEAARAVVERAASAGTEATYWREHEASYRQVLADLVAAEVRVSDARLAREAAWTAAEAHRTDASEALTALEARLQKGAETMARARTLASAWAAYQSAREAADAAAQRLDRLETLVTELGPKGRRVPALQAAISGWLATVGACLPGMSFVVEVEPWRILVNGRRADRLSTSERLRVSLAVQAAVAKASGVGVIAVDGFELFDRATRQQASAILSEVIPSLGVQVLVAVTRDDRPGQAGDSEAYASAWLGGAATEAAPLL